MPQSLFEIYSADNGVLLYSGDLFLEHQIELTKNQMDEDMLSLHPNFGNYSPTTHLAIYSDSQQTLYSLMVDLGGDKNEKGEPSHIPKVDLVNKMQLPFKPN